MRAIINFLKILDFIIKPLPKISFFATQRALYTKPYRALCRFQLYHTKNYQRTITRGEKAKDVLQLYHTKNYQRTITPQKGPGVELPLYHTKNYQRTITCLPSYARNLNYTIPRITREL